MILLSTVVSLSIIIMTSKNEEIFTTDESICLKHKFTFPELTQGILNKISFNVSKKDLINLLNRINEGYGLMVDLNKKFDLKLQYHGRFESFLIGIGTNFENSNQPDFKLLRIETSVEKTHNNRCMAFLGEAKIKGPHIHWYNSFYNIFISQGIFNLTKPDKRIYNKIIKVFLDNNKDFKSNIDLFKNAVPYDIFLKLCDLIINKKRKLREDGYITLNKELKKNPKQVLNQILNRELL